MKSFEGSRILVEFILDFCYISSLNFRVNCTISDLTGANAVLPSRSKSFNMLSVASKKVATSISFFSVTVTAANDLGIVSKRLAFR